MMNPLRKCGVRLDCICRFTEQFVRYVGHAVQGDLGESFRSQRPVIDEIAAIYHHTLLLALGGIFFSILIGIPAGFFSAVYRNSWFDRLSMIGALSGISMPVFWLGILLIIFFSFKFRIFPTIGVGDQDNPWSVLYHLALPAISLGPAGGGAHRSGDAVEFSGNPGAGLHSDRPDERALRGHNPGKARFSKRPTAHRHGDRAGPRSAPWRDHRHGNCFQPPGHGEPSHRVCLGS